MDHSTGARPLCYAPTTRAASMRSTKAEPSRLRFSACADDPQPTRSDAACVGGCDMSRRRGTRPMRVRDVTRRAPGVTRLAGECEKTSVLLDELKVRFSGKVDHPHQDIVPPEDHPHQGRIRNFILHGNINELQDAFVNRSEYTELASILAARSCGISRCLRWKGTSVSAGDCLAEATWLTLPCLTCEWDAVPCF